MQEAAESMVWKKIGYRLYYALCSPRAMPYQCIASPMIELPNQIGRSYVNESYWMFIAAGF